MQSLPSRARLICPRGLWLCFCCVLAAGCESLDTAGVSLTARPADDGSGSRSEEQYRRQYQTSRDPEAMRWLLAHRIESGMSVVDVNHVLGEEGTRALNDRWVKTNGGHYRSGDVVYKWGPENQGKSVYLVFRDGHLVNFDPNEYR